ncbi:bZIP transcription factor, bZIP-1 [Metarhizium guizhouense ARSEF 977]|uniref:BZIP transcription factor, bZIP-1 n=1 Tax=Metarhizium guizhouense (strain ARSEF 977) TaxID=1276136 RepID=A0A0B4H8B2_METGA|nr:bZIP transcription factor, bZIP-1 [Metarhizium guizhouense ARSEF 977]
MHEKNDQMPLKSPWPEFMGFSFPQSPVGQSQKMSGLFQPDEVDAVIDAPGFYLADNLGHLFSGPLPSTDEVAQTPGSSSSSQSSDGCSSGLDDAVACPQPSSRKMVALAPAQPRSPPSAESQLPQGSRYHKRREQNRVAQRAFRQRKEQHLKDLEDKVAVLEATRDRINAENARLQEDLERATIEHSLLQNLTTSSSGFDCADRSDGLSISAPGREWLASPPQTSSSEPHSLAASRPRYCGHELNAGQIWEFIIGHRLFQEGLADVDTIARELRRFFPGDGMGGITEDILTHCIHESARLRQEGYRLQLTDKFRPSSI